MNETRFLSASGAPVTRPDHFELPCGTHRLVVAPWGEATLAVRVEGEAPLPASPAALSPQAPGALHVDDLDGAWRVSVPGLAVRVAADPLALTLETPDGAVLWGPVAIALTNGKLTLSGDLAPDDALYGLGEKPGFLDRRGRAYTMWNTDNPGPHVETHDAIYQSIPWLVPRHDARHVGLLFDDPGKTHFDLGAVHPDRWSFTADGPGLRLFAVGGPDLGGIVRRYAALTGKMPLPPRWALGFQQSRWSYPTADEITAIAGEFRQRRLPADVIHVDIDYMDAYRVFTWHPGRFPDPAAFVAGLREQGFRTVTIVDPGVKRDRGYAVHDECVERGLYVREANGEPFIGDVWPGPCVFPDFLREDTRRWWGDWHRGLVETGVAGIWCDMNEPAVSKPLEPVEKRTMPEDVVHGPLDAPLPHRAAHNLYGFHMAQATREGLSRLAPTRRPFVITRAGYAGVQRHAMVWTGDNHSMWSHLELGVAICLGMSISGVPFVGPDVGGFGGDCTPELLARWMQCGAFTPFYRNHSAMGTRRQEPWAFGERTEALCRKALEWRYRLLPYLYTAFAEAAETGTPIMRPMPLAFPDDLACARLSDQYMFGPDLLVAPVMRPGTTQRMVYFPAGLWTHWLDGSVQQGPGNRVVDAPPDSIPVFVRQGAVLPEGPVVQHTGEAFDTLTLRVTPGATLSGAWYDDDGESLSHQHGAYARWTFSGRWSEHGGRLAIACAHAGYMGGASTFRVEAALASTPRAVRVDGALSTAWRHEAGQLSVVLPMRAVELAVEA